MVLVPDAELGYRIDNGYCNPCSLDRQFLAFKEQNNAGRGVAEIFDPFEILGTTVITWSLGKDKGLD
jgi:hypothetical protein